MSKVFPSGHLITSTEFTPYYDEEGDFHNHDPNTTTSHFKCSQGHVWSINGAYGSCKCGWKASTEPAKIILHELTRDVDFGPCASG